MEQTLSPECPHVNADPVVSYGGDVLGRQCRLCHAFWARRVCEECGTDLWMSARQLGVHKRFCGTRCRHRAYRARLRRALLAAFTLNGDLLFATA